MDESSITVGELIEALGEFADDTEIRLAQQPSWPMEYGLQRTSPLVQAPVADAHGGDTDVVYLVEGAQLGYLPESARDQIGW
jgi:hypothetical protein